MSRAEAIQLFVKQTCPLCDADTVIYRVGVTECPECGAPLLPCSVCGRANCDMHGCRYFESGEVMPNPPISKEWAKHIAEYL